MHDWPIYLGALAAQFAFDFAVAGIGSSLGHGVRLRTLLQFLRLGVRRRRGARARRAWRSRSRRRPRASPSSSRVPLVGLLLHFSRERRRRIDHALELSDAYRGTAFLLGDVVEADDAYTGSHSRHVVDLVLGVCDRLGPRPGSPPRQRVRGAAPRRREDPDPARDHPEARPARPPRSAP